MMNRVFAIAMSDSVHGIIRMEKSHSGKTATKWFREVLIICFEMFFVGSLLL